MIYPKFVLVILVAAMLCLPFPSVAGEASKPTLLKRQELSGLSEKEGVMLTVLISPGDSSPMHRHKAHTFVYVLEGSVVMQLEGQEPVTLKQGETFYESPEDIHKVTKNLSTTQSAKFLVFFVKDRGTPLLLPFR